jgi:hypothetical protein
MNRKAKLFLAAGLFIAAVVITVLAFGSRGPGGNPKLEAHAEAISAQLRATEEPPPPPSLPPPERRGPRRGE